MPRYAILLASLTILALGFAASASAQSVSVSGFLARYDTDQDYCQDEVSRIERMSNAIPGANCPPKDMSIDTMTSSVIGKLKEIVEDDSSNASVNADIAIEQVLPVLWPCSQ